MIYLHCIGVFDGKHIVIQALAKSGSLLLDCSERFSIVLFAICMAGRQGDSASAYLFVFWLTCDPSQHERVLKFIEILRNIWPFPSFSPISGEFRLQLLWNLIGLIRIFVIFCGQLFSFFLLSEVSKQ